MLYNKDWDKKSNSVADLINKAADIIETRGSAKGVLYAHPSWGLEKQGFCVQGALMSALGVTDDEFVFGNPWETAGSEHFQKAMDAIKQSPVVQSNLAGRGFTRNTVVAWNNSLKTSQEEIVSTLRAVAKELVDA